MNQTPAAAAESVSKSVVDGLLAKGTRRQLTPLSTDPEIRFPYLHLEAWGEGKSGKTDLGLRARTHEIRAPGKPSASGFGTEPGEVLIPSKPLVIAYANFDRDPATVVVNLPADVEIIEEPLYLDENDEPYAYVGPVEVDRILKRLDEFFNEVDGVVDLVVLDGATIIWEDVRTVKLGDPAGTDPDGNPHHLPRQYGPANAEMRSRVMQRFYGLRAHTYVTHEASEKWASASGPVLDASGNAVLRMDGWNKTKHYIDVGGQMKIAQVAGQAAGSVKAERQFICDLSVNAAMIGQRVANPSFSGLYQRTYPKVPLLKREDREEFDRLQKEHEGKLTWT